MKLVAGSAVVGVLAIFSFVAALTSAFEWEGWWVTTVLVALALLLLGLKLWNDVVRPWQKAKKALAVEHTHAQAVGLSMNRGGDGIGITVSNTGSHQVTTIRILGHPVEPAVSGPVYECSQAVGVTFRTTGPSALWAEVDQLVPGEGWGLGRYRLPSGSVDTTEIEFEVSWIDHGGLRRASFAEVDLMTSDGTVSLQPRPRRGQ